MIFNHVSLVVTDEYTLQVLKIVILPTRCKSQQTLCSKVSGLIPTETQMSIFLFTWPWMSLPA